jgi:hypothetical protein
MRCRKIPPAKIDRQTRLQNDGTAAMRTGYEISGFGPERESGKTEYCFEPAKDIEEKNR